MTPRGVRISFRRVHFMRHPFWRWTGWLSIGLSGCLHGQDWRAAVTKPTTRSVADRRESSPHPKVVGPFRSESPKFVPNAAVANPSQIATRPAAINRTSQVPQQDTLPPAVKPESRPRDQKVTPVGYEVPATTPAATSPASVELPRTAPYAEFERTIPQRRSSVASPVVPQAEPVEVVVVEESKVETSEPEKATALPIITPAGALISSKPATAQGSRSRSLEPEDSLDADQTRGLFSKSAAPAKEMPDVTDATDATANDSTNTNAKPVARPQDVSVLVEQVFEDLRQRRINDARQRTEWLKQLVKKRAPANPSNAVAEESPAATEDSRLNEPRRLDVDPQATALKKPASESFFDDEESTNCK